MRSKRVRLLSLAIIALALLKLSAVSQERSLPGKLTAAILVKVLEFEEKLANDSEIRIHILDDIEVFHNLELYVTASGGEVNVTKVTAGEEMPEGGVDVLFVTDQQNVLRCLEYTREHGALSVTNDFELVRQGISLGIYDDEGMPGILLNRESSRAESRVWSHEILDVAELFRK